VNGGGYATIEINDVPSKLVIDGFSPKLSIDDPTSAEELIEEVSEFKTATIGGLEVIQTIPRRMRLVQKDLGFRPWIIITTINGNGWYKFPKTGTLTYRPLPLLQRQEFYSPKYNVASSVILPDYRSTLYWEPNITTDQSGRATVSFYTSDIKGKYTVKVEGLSPDGELGDGTFTINKAAHESN